MTNKIAMNDDELDLVSGGTILPYVVQLGDSLQTIAAKYHVTPEQLVDWNNLQNTNSVQAGQQLKIKY
jgi:LysM repeat protein